jgi:phytoene dehydrogenase-like protein
VARAAIIGAGFGGLGCALQLAALGHDVVLFEALKVPGGCAQTFSKRGARFDAGATLTAGLSDDGLFTERLAAYGITIPLAPDETFTIETAEGTFTPTGPRTAWVEALCRAAPGHAAAVRAWSRTQQHVADALWPLFRDPALLPPINRRWGAHLGSIPGLTRLVPWWRRTLAECLDAHGLTDAPVVRRVIDSLCQITVQGVAAEVDAITAMAAIDYGWRGVGSPVGGMGRLADALVEACRRAGADVRLATRVVGVARTPHGWQVAHRGGEDVFDEVVFNLLPEDVDALLGQRAAAPARAVDGWGAAMHYVTLRDDPTWSAGPRHAILRGRVEDPTTHGHQVFASLAERSDARAPAHLRAVTLSTHIGADAPPEHVAEVQARMLETVDRRWPGFLDAIVTDDPGSPRTFTRFVRRTGGYVGGPVRRPSWRLLLDAFPRPFARGAWRVGDSGFPGQSTLATFIGGERVAAAIGAARR